jgi:hypothetical protein
MNGVKAFQRESHQYSINYVPVELDFGTGTKDLHWDEEGFFNYELMEGRTSISRGAWVSSTTIASMRDLGYDTVELPTDNIPEPVSITIVSALLGVLVIYRRKTGSDRSSQCPF